MKKFVLCFCLCFIMGILGGCNENEDSSDMTSSGGNSIAKSEATVSGSSSETDAKAAEANLSAIDNTTLGWGMGNELDELNRPVSSIDFQKKYGAYGADFIRENTNTIYLTFDEGYEQGYTPQILDTLKEKEVPAVFFVTLDYAEKNPDLIQRMIDEGHIVGNHTCTHPSMPSVSIEECKEEIQKLDNYIQSNFQYKMNLIRPPMGEFSERTLAITQNLNYKTILWSYAYRDWDPASQPEETSSLNKMVERVHNGAIYLLHATSQTNANILGDFIDQTQQKGYVFGNYNE